MPNSKLQHVPEALKHIADASTFISVVTAWTVVITPLLQFGVLLLAIVWGYFRVQDIYLSIYLKKLKIRRHEDI